MFTYRLVLTDVTANKFNLYRIDLGGDLVRGVIPGATSYDRALAIAEMSGDTEHDPYQEFKIQWPRHAYVIGKMESGCKDRWIAAIFLGRIGEPEMNILWESAAIIEKHPGLKNGGLTVDFQGKIHG